MPEGQRGLMRHDARCHVAHRFPDVDRRRAVVRVAAEGVADEHRVVPLRRQLAVSLVGHVNGAQSGAAAQFQVIRRLPSAPGAGSAA